MVKVVVRERTDGVGEENVLPSPPPLPIELNAPPAVAFVSAFEWAASESIVSWLVDTVGATDLLPIVGGGCPSLDTGSETLL